MLFRSLLLLAVSFTGVATAPSYAWLLPLMALAGLGNSIFHPCDYSIMSARIEQSRVGRAFSIHALAGTAGYAAAPLTMLALAAFVPWNVAILAPVLFAKSGTLETEAVYPQNAAPAAAYLFGTDGAGRSVMAMVVWGARISLTVGLVDRKSTRLNSSHVSESRMPSSA